MDIGPSGRFMVDFLPSAQEYCFEVSPPCTHTPPCSSCLAEDALDAPHQTCLQSRL